MERETGFEPATSTLARSHSTTELLPLSPPIINNKREQRQWDARSAGARCLRAVLWPMLEAAKRPAAWGCRSRDPNLMQRAISKLLLLVMLSGMSVPLLQAALPPTSPHCMRPTSRHPAQPCHDMAGMQNAQASQGASNTPAADSEFHAAADCCPNHDCCRSMGCSERAFVPAVTFSQKEMPSGVIASPARPRHSALSLIATHSGRAPPHFS